MTTAVQRLQPSKLLNQNQLMVSDVDLATLNLALKGKASLQVIEAVVDANVTRTIEGASTVVISVFDRDRELLNSGRLGKNTDIKIDGLWFRFVSFRKNGDYLDLTFEDREVAVMRTYKKHIVVARKSVSRARFIKRMVNEVKEFKIPFVCPEIDKLPEIRGITSNTAPYDPNLKGQQQYARNPGFAPWTQPGGPGDAFTADLTVNRLPMNAVQQENTDRVLQVGASRGAARSVLVAAVIVINEESHATNLSYSSDGLSAGLFQQIFYPHKYWWGTKEQVMDIEWSANQFYDRAIAAYQKNPSIQPEYIALEGQVAGNQEGRIIPIWKRFREEAERTVSHWGFPLGAASSGVGAKSTIEERRAQEAANNQTSTPSDSASFVTAETGGMSLDLEQDASDHQFQRGIMTILDGQTKLKLEHTWECSGRLAEEINWRRFMVSGSFYLMSEPYLFRSRPIMKINEDSDGVMAIDGEYTVGANNATISVTCHISRWAAPPGSMIYIYRMGPLSGRWLVSEISRNLFTTEATISLKKPRPILPEPILDQETALTFDINAANASVRPDDRGGLQGPGSVTASNYTQDTEEALGTLRRLIDNGQLKFDHENDRSGLRLGRAVLRSDGTNVEIDPAVIQFIAWAADNFAPLRVSSLIGSHSRLVAGSNRESRHWTGHALDIGSISGKRVDDSTATPAVQAFMRAVNALPLQTRPNQQICNGCGANDVEVQALQIDNKQPKGGVWVSDHTDHVHIGY